MAERTASTHPGLHSCGEPQARRKLPFDTTLTLNLDVVLEGIPHSPCFPILYEGAELEIRGSFEPLDWRWVDLPRAETRKPELWMERLPFEI